MKLFNLLMGKGEASSRRAWMEEERPPGGG
jgi:hypothetical protein